MDGKGIAILAQEQDSFGGGFHKKQSFNGRISQVNMFTRYTIDSLFMIWINFNNSRELTNEEILSIASCTLDIEGDVIRWGTNWSVFGDVIQDTSIYKELCGKPFEQDLVVIPEPVTFYDAAFICSYLSTEIFTVNDELYDYDILYNKFNSEIDLKVGN